MHIKSVKFVKSSISVQDCPISNIPEYALVGRSNVGKSSLINLLTNRKKIAKTAATPGKTQLINHFLINENWYLVDLPGYGWAKISKTTKATWKKMIYAYLLERQNLACIFVLIDIRHEPQQIDMDFMEWLGTHEIPFSIIFTKADKLGKNQRQENIANYKMKMKDAWEELPPTFISSSVEQIGVEKIMNFINQINTEIAR